MDRSRLLRRAYRATASPPARKELLTHLSQNGEAGADMWLAMANTWPKFGKIGLNARFPRRLLSRLSFGRDSVAQAFISYQDCPCLSYRRPTVGVIKYDLNVKTRRVFGSFWVH